MKIKSLLLAAATMVGLTFSLAANAQASGTLNFTGTVAASCSVTITANGTTSATNPASTTVTLPTVPTSSLAAAATTAGNTTMTFNLSGCSVGQAQHIGFTSTHTAADGNLTNTGTATNVELQLLNPASAVINLSTGANDGAGTGGTVGAGGTLALNYFVQYYATGVATAGTVVSSATWTVAYN